MHCNMHLYDDIVFDIVRFAAICHNNEFKSLQYIPSILNYKFTL